MGRNLWIYSSSSNWTQMKYARNRSTDHKFIRRTSTIHGLHPGCKSIIKGIQCPWFASLEDFNPESSADDRIQNCYILVRKLGAIHSSHWSKSSIIPCSQHIARITVQRARRKKKWVEVKFKMGAKSYWHKTDRQFNTELSLPISSWFS